MLGGELGERRQRGEPDAAAEHDDVLPAGLEAEADAERARDVELSAGLQHRHAERAAPLAFVEEFEPSAGPVYAVYAHRPAHPYFRAVRGGAEEMEELARFRAERALRRVEHQELVGLVHQVVRDHAAHELARYPVGIGVRLAEAHRGGGVLVGCGEILHCRDSVLD